LYNFYLFFFSNQQFPNFCSKRTFQCQLPPNLAQSRKKRKTFFDVGGEIKHSKSNIQNFYQKGIKTKKISFKHLFYNIYSYAQKDFHS